MKTSLIGATLGALALGVAFSSVRTQRTFPPASTPRPDTNPFFVKMKEGATAKARNSA